jgi:UDP-2,3-diacylglucosamine pyrophosphatase LpxH
MLFGIGLVVGVGLALVASLLLRFLTGPLIESLFEMRESKVREELVKSPLPGPHAVLLSDVHVDTWPLGGEYEDHTKDFEKFIGAITASKTVESLYFGGDFADIPVHPKFHYQPPLLAVGQKINAEFGVLQGQESLLKHLGAVFDSAQRVVGITGNHDLGINGVRFVRGEHAFWNPAILISGHPSASKPLEKQVYIEHGHRFDPLNWLYLRYSILDLTRRGYDEGPPQAPPPTERKLRQMVEGRLGTSKETGILVRQGMPGSTAMRDSLGTYLVRLRYRGQARQALRRLRRVHPGVKAFVCGHTHLPDRYRFADGTLYVNLGDWSGDTGHKTYALLDGDGELHGPIEWDGTLPG